MRVRRSSLIGLVAGTLDAPKRNPKHAEHRRSILQRMMRDQDLDDFLRDNFPKLVDRAD